MVHVEVSPNAPRILTAVDCVLLPEREQPVPAKSFLDVCDLCWYSGDSKPKQVKEVFGVTACQACYLGMKAINR